MSWLWTCQVKSASNPFRDEAYTRADWDRHVTWRRYLPEGLALPIVVASLSPLILWSVLVSLCLGLYASYAEPRGWPQVSNHPDLIVPFTLTSFALSLLMLFKTNSSYGRWWEARTQLGQVYINSRSLMRMAVAWVGPKQPDIVRAMHCWITALMPSLCAFLRENPHYYRHLEGVLRDDEVEWLGTRGIPPMAVLQVISSLVATAELADQQRAVFETVLSQCDTMVGSSEKIQRQPVPRGYNRSTHRFLFCYITFLPFALWPLYGWATLPIMAVLSLLLLGVENIGIQIEEPFRVLPLDQMCAATRRATVSMLDDMHSVYSMAAASIATRQELGKHQQQAHHHHHPQQQQQQQRMADERAGHLMNGPASLAAPAGMNGQGEELRRAAPYQFSQITALPEDLQQEQQGGYGVPISQLLGLAVGRAPRTEGRSSWEGPPWTPRAAAVQPMQQDGGVQVGGAQEGAERGPQLRRARWSYEDPGARRQAGGLGLGRLSAALRARVSLDAPGRRQQQEEALVPVAADRSSSSSSKLASGGGDGGGGAWGPEADRPAAISVSAEDVASRPAGSSPGVEHGAQLQGSCDIEQGGHGLA